MKRFFSILLAASALFIFSDVKAQIRKIPATVTEALKKQYPKATDIEWNDKLTGYSATFQSDDQKMTAFYKNDASWERTEIEITYEALPKEVQDGRNKSKYSDWENGDVYKIELPGNKVQYRVQVEKSDVQKRNLYFTPEGRLLKDKITL